MYVLVTFVWIHQLCDVLVYPLFYFGDISKVKVKILYMPDLEETGGNSLLNTGSKINEGLFCRCVCVCVCVSSSTGLLIGVGNSLLTYG